MLGSKRLLLALAFVVALAPAVYGAVAFDVFNNGATGTGNLSWTHTPTGTPRGALVVCSYATGTDNVTTVTYGGVTMVEVGESPLIKTTGEVSAVHGFFLGSSVPTGAQTVAVTASAPTNGRCSSYTVTAADDTSVTATDAISSDSVADPTGTLNVPPGVEAFIASVIMSGQDLTTSVTPGSGYTQTGVNDFGTVVRVTMRRTNNTTGGDTTYTWTQTAEDALVLAVAIREGIPSAPSVSARRTLLGVGK